MLSVSIVLPCYHRGQYLAKTLRSFEKYPNLDVIVVEDDKDDLTEEIADRYGARYFHHERTENYPPFQSVAKVFNFGIRQSKSDIIILQAPEVYHMGDVISQLVAPLEKNPRSRVIAQTEALDEERKILGSSGARPQAILKSTLEEIGCFEEQFFGYGYEDDFLVWLLNHNGIDDVNISAKTFHQWHAPTPYEPFTGHANRAICWTLTAEMLWEGRPFKANSGSFKKSSWIEEWRLQSLVHRTFCNFHNPTYSRWAQNWLEGIRNDDDTFDARNQASAALAGRINFSETFIATRTAESAWALQWADKCWKEYLKAYFEGDNIWAGRLFKCHEAFQSLASIAFRTAQRVINGEEPLI